MRYLLTRILVIASAGALGAVARYALSGVVHRLFGASFPYGTLVVNMAGCFIFGLVWALAQGRVLMTGDNRTAILIGFVGAFTTFSSFIYESFSLLRGGQVLLFALNIVGQNAAGILFLVLGIAVAGLF